MARPKTDFPAAEAILACADNEGRLALKVTPGARSESIVLGSDAVMVKVRAKPADGEANAAVLALLAEALDLPTSRLRMLRGATGRIKLVLVLQAGANGGT